MPFIVRLLLHVLWHKQSTLSLFQSRTVTHCDMCKQKTKRYNINSNKHGCYIQGHSPAGLSLKKKKAFVYDAFTCSSEWTFLSPRAFSLES